MPKSERNLSGMEFWKVANALEKDFLTDTGKVIEQPGKETFIRERRRLKKYKNKGLAQETISGAYKSWRGNLKNCHYRLSKMDELYKSLYGEKCW